jgi:hypothetical protein
MSKSSRPVRRCLRKLECESRGEVRLDCRFKEGALQQAATTRPPRLTIRIRYFTLSCTSLSIHAVALLDNPHMHVRHMLIYFYFSHTMKPLVTSPRRTLHSHSLGTCRSGQRSRRSNTRITIKEQPLFFFGVHYCHRNKFAHGRMWRYGAGNPMLPKHIRHPKVLAVCVAQKAFR